MAKPKKIKQSIQSQGGKARAAKMTPAERSELARTAALARWENTEGVKKVPRATHMGTLRIGDTDIPCAVLEDGRRVLTQEGFGQAIGREGNLYRKPGQDFQLPPFLTANNLKSFISNDLRSSFAPVQFRTLSGKPALGYLAELLPQVCKVFLDARDSGVLTSGPRGQEHIARVCDLMIRGFATVGILALIDEATGYQEERDRGELQKILALFIAKELLPWTRRFPPEFYKEMFRLRGWKTYDHNAAQGPRFAGKLTNELVYERLPSGVLDELRRKNPVVDGRRKHAHHQYLSENIGNPHLERHIVAVTALMRAARTWPELEDMANRALPPRALPAPNSDPQLRTAALDE